MGKIIGNRAAGGSKPSTPTIGAATDGGTGTTVSVAFTPSSYIGKGTIQYTVTSSPGNITATGSSSPITVTGLTTGTAYAFTVRGTTNYGVLSDSSAASNSVTPVVPITPFFTANYDWTSGPNAQGTKNIAALSNNQVVLYSSTGLSSSQGGSNNTWQSVLQKFDVSTPALAASTGLRNQTIGGGRDTYARGIAVDASDNVYAAAVYYNNDGIARPLVAKRNSSLDAGTGYISLMDNSGGNSAHLQALRFDNNGNLRFCGYRSGGIWQGYVARLNSDGTVNSSVGFYENGASGGTFCNDVAWDSSGNCYAVGSYYNAQGYNVAYRQKFNSSMSFSGVVNVPNPNGTMRSTNFACIKVDSSGNQYIGGFMENSGQGREGLLYKVNSSGTRVWGLRIVSSLVAGSRYTFINDLWLDEANGYIYAYGSDYLLGSQYIGFVAKFDLNGTNQWVRQIYANTAPYSLNTMTTISGGSGVQGFPLFSINQSQPANATGWYYTGGGLLPADGSKTGTKTITNKTTSPTGLLELQYVAGSYTFPNETTLDNVAGMSSSTSVITGGGPGSYTTSNIGLTNTVVTI